MDSVADLLAAMERDVKQARQALGTSHYERPEQ